MKRRSIGLYIGWALIGFAVTGFLLSLLFPEGANIARNGVAIFLALLGLLVIIVATSGRRQNHQ